MDQHPGHLRSVNATSAPYGSPATDLTDMIARGGEPQAAAFLALCDRGDPGALRAILDYSRSEDWRLRRLAAEHLGHWTSNRAALSRLRDLGAGDTSEYVVRTAIEQLGLVGDPASLGQTLELALNESGETQLTALRALERLGTPGDFAAVLALFKNRPTDAVRKQAGWVLKAIATSEQWHTLFSAFASEPLDRHRVWACELAGDHGDEEVLDSLALLLEDRNGHVRKAAAAAEARITARTSADAV